MTDIRDGSYCQQHELVCRHPDRVKLALYCDDFEILNPIASLWKKLKLCVFYYSLLNIHPAFRNKPQAVQLLTVVKTIHVKEYGVEKLLSDFKHQYPY